MRSSVVAIVVALGACKGKPPPQQQQLPPVGSAVAPVAAGSGSAGDVAPDIVIPAGDGTPPRATAAPIAADKLKELSLAQFVGFTREVTTASDTRLEVRQITEGHPRITTTIAIDACGSACVPADLAQWTPKLATLKAELPADIAKATDTQFDLGMTDVHGAKVITTTQLGLAGSATSYAVRIYYNDGINRAQVTAAYDDKPLARDALLADVPRADLERLAKGFLDAYTHRW